jgi:hypothetical protein
MVVETGWNSQLEKKITKGKGAPRNRKHLNRSKDCCKKKLAPMFSEVRECWEIREDQIIAAKKDRLLVKMLM